MMRNFIKANSLKEADAIIAKKRGLGVFDHFIIYMGCRSGEHLFIANDAKGGVKWFSESEIFALVKDFEPIKIRRFMGNAIAREHAMQRARNELGKSYSLIDFNCEHLANYVQYGVRVSQQVEFFKSSFAAVCILLLIAIIFNLE